MIPSYVVILGLGLVIALLLVAYISPIIRADDRMLDERLAEIEKHKNGVKKKKNDAEGVSPVQKKKSDSERVYSPAGTDWDIFDTPEMQAFLPDRRLEAIKLYREHKGVSLKEASEAIADYLDSQPHEQAG